jgi:hypothetical protein
MNQRHFWLPAAGLLAGFLLAGCAGDHPEKVPAAKSVAPAKDAPPEDAKIAAALAKLSPEDRKLAEAQRWCAVEDENRLGTMGTPYKVMVKDQPVFLCCKGCQKRALADPEKTLAHVAELKTKAREVVEAR